MMSSIAGLMYKAAVDSVRGRTIMAQVLKIDNDKLIVTKPQFKSHSNDKRDDENQSQHIEYDLRDKQIYIIGAG